MTDKKRRARKLATELGSGKSDPELAKLGDEELLESYERELSGEAQRERERAERERVDPFFGYLRDPDFTDDKLLAMWDEIAAAVAAELPAMTDAQFRAARKRVGDVPLLGMLYTREAERRWPKPIPPEPVAEVVEPHPVLLEPHTLEPAPPPIADPGAHTGHAVDGCLCMCCTTHRRCEAEELTTRAIAAASENDPMEPGSVIVAPNATAEVRAALNAKQQ